MKNKKSAGVLVAVLIALCVSGCDTPQEQANELARASASYGYVMAKVGLTEAQMLENLERLLTGND